MRGGPPELALGGHGEVASLPDDTAEARAASGPQRNFSLPNMTCRSRRFRQIPAANLQRAFTGIATEVVLAHVQAADQIRLYARHT